MGATFELKRFAWGTPDRLEVSGVFGGLPDTPAEASPVLVVKAGDTVHRLPAIPESLDGPPADGRPWQAQFAWQDPPFAFAGAELRIGEELAVDLPEPSMKRRLVRPRTLEVRTAEPAAAEPAAADPAAPEPAEPPRDRLGSQVDLLAAQEEAREARAVLEQTQAELARAREDLQAERERRAGDGERFREGLAQVRAAAEDAVTAEQVTITQLRAELQEAQTAAEEKDAALAAMRTQLEAAEANAQTETEALRERVAKFEHAQSAVDEARGDAERLLDRLNAIRAT